MPVIIAHRGASIERPENTLSSVERAIELAVDCIEIDIHLSKDRIPVLIHDSTTHRTTNGNLHVEKATLKELKNLDAGSWFHPQYRTEKIPTLQEILQLNFKKTSLMIEIKKSHFPPQIVVEAVISTIKKFKNINYYIGSFEPEIIQAVKQIDPDIAVLGIVGSPLMIDAFTDIRVDKMVMWHVKASKEIIDALQHQGIPTWVFTIDTIKEAQKMVEFGAEGIITNNPALLFNQ